MKDDHETADGAEYVITIYHNGVHFEAPMRGKDRYLKEKAFLNELQGWHFPSDDPPAPIPDLKTDFYMLNDEELEAYSTFRKTLGKR